MLLSEQARIAAALEAVGAAGAVTVTVAAVPVYDPAMELAEAWGTAGADLIAAAFEPQVPEADVAAALERGDRSWLKRTLAGGLERTLGPVLQAHAIKAAAAGYAATLAAWGAPEAHAAIPLPPKLVQWISKAVASELKGLVSGGKQAVRQAVQAAVAKGGVSPATVRAVRQSIALTARQTKTLDKFRAKLKAEGLKGQRLTKAVLAESKRMLDERARFIAEEETAKAMAMAQRVAWGALAQTGRINRKWLKLWVTMRDKDVCVVCEDLDGETAPLDGLFDDEFYGPPEPHKKCRCRLMLVAPDGKRERHEAHEGGNEPGHPFWGNQYTGGAGGDLDEAIDDAKLRLDSSRIEVSDEDGMPLSVEQFASRCEDALGIRGAIIAADAADIGKNTLPGARVRLSVAEDSVLVHSQNDYGELERLYREFNGSVEVEHLSFDIEKDHQGEGHAARMMETSMRSYLENNIAAVNIGANSDVGGYAWARAGFEARSEGQFRKDVFERPAWKALSQDRQDELLAGLDKHGTHSPAWLASQPEGKSILLGMSWAGRLDLTTEHGRKVAERFAFGED